MDIDRDEFGQIFSDIKERYLSNPNFPKLIIGTGLSITIGVPGMWELSKKLDQEFNKAENREYKNIWEKYYPKIESDGLEDALLDISMNEEDFVNKIREITSDFILEEEYKKHSQIYSESSGFERLLRYLANTVSVNNPVIDIMTPNYDRIIEMMCDKLNIDTTLGFKGNIYQTFDEEILRKPKNYFPMKRPLVRLFKPHGSVNWIKEKEVEYQVNDYNFLKSRVSQIDIITPGSMKYKAGMINSIFRCHREIFNSLISDQNNNFSIFIYGYGFNDQHFNTVFQNTSKNVLVLTRTINKEILDKSLVNKNWTIFYKYESDKPETNVSSGSSFLIHKGNKYNLNRELWDIKVFAEVFLG